MIFALVGNQNCGKTTLFNQLTGSNQHVGNFPGVTVDSKEGVMRGAKGCSVVDLPGIYSLRPYTAEEIVTRDFILNQKPDGIINIVDATNIERNLYLTLQLLEMQIPMVLALNMMDEVRGNGGTIDVQKMSDELGIPVVPIAAAKNEGIEDLVESAVRVAHTRTLPKRVDFCDDGPVHRCIHAVSHLIEDHAQAAGMARRFAATKLIEGDEDIISRLLLNQNELEMVEHSIVEMEDEGKLDRNAAIASMRYDYIERLCSKTVVKCRESREHLRSVRIDRVLTNKYAALPIFVGIMLLIFWLTFDVVGAGLQDLLALGISRLSAVVDHGLTAYGMNPVVHSLIIDGIFAGVGSVVSFLPIIVVMFFFLSILEDTGYMARVAFVMDKLLRKIGLSGRSIVPMLIGFGCRRDGNADAAVRSRSPSDDPADAVHELLGQDPDLCRVHGGILPAARCARYGTALLRRHGHRRAHLAAAESHGVPRKSRPVRHGAAELSPADAQERGHAPVGQGARLPAARVYGHFRGDACHLVPGVV